MLFPSSGAKVNRDGALMLGHTLRGLARRMKGSIVRS
jgi:hypothetical protein